MSFLDKLLGKPLATHEEEGQRIGVFAGIPMLGLDALASSAYGPEAALTLLIPLGASGLGYITPIIGTILVLLTILYFSYRQTIAAYPGGGGSYTVAKENLGTGAGLLAAASLLLDYVLTVAVGISAGVGALISAVPSLHAFTLPLCLLILGLITIVNLRGVRESGLAFALPTYLFLISLFAVLGIGLFQAVTSGGHPAPIHSVPAIPPAAVSVSLWLLMRSFASGCTAMTGVEAVSNGVGAFANPGVKNAQKTLTAIVALLGLLLGGIAYLCRVYHIAAMNPEEAGYDSVISQLVSAIVGRGVFYYITIGSVLAVLALSANTGFADFPRLCRLIAQDNYLPHAFANRGRRLVYSLGILVLAVLSGLLLAAFGGITDRLIPLYAVGAFGAFTLSQAGMVRHWRRLGGKGASTSLLVNGVGCAATGIALVVVLAAKFTEGAWVTLILIPCVLWLFGQVKGHYDHVKVETSCTRPLDLADLQPPILVVPVKSWNTISEKALRFALKLSPEVMAVHISSDEAEAEHLQEQWKTYVLTPLEGTALPQPHLTLISSPYRRVFNPLFGYINELKTQYPDRLIAVIVPELVETKWYQYFLHNQRATALKAALLLKGGNRVVVINVPWYLGEK